MRKNKYLSIHTIKLLWLSVICCFWNSCGSINTENDIHFDVDGYATYTHLDSASFAPVLPSKIKFYFEVSGSMKGFFRSDKKTDFKRDVNSVLNKYSAISEIFVIEDLTGEKPRQMSEANFQQAMNTGAFNSKISTIIPDLLNNIMNNLDAKNGEVAVFVSDMKYDPSGERGEEVLVTQYSSSIEKLFSQFGNAVSLVCATSDFLGKNGCTVSNVAPYYFVIIGDGPNVAEVRNCIAGVLSKKDRFVDNIEVGFDYGRPVYSFGVPSKCYQMVNSEPTFVGYEDEADGDTCMIIINVTLKNYRWIMTNEEYFKAAFFVKAIYGSSVRVSDIEMDKKNSMATVKVKVFNMIMDSEVLEWGLNLPDTDYTFMSEFLEGVTDPNDPKKSFSVKDFCEGMFGGLTNKLEPNYILISKNN